MAMFQRILLLFALNGILLTSYAQLPAKEIRKKDFKPQLEQLDETFGKNKSFPQEFALPCLVALSRFPELEDSEIEVTYGKIRTTMEARPVIRFLFRKRSRRKYRVYINSDKEKIKAAALGNVPFDAQVGILAHEFAHVLHYKKKGIFGLAAEGIKYVFSKSFRSNFEKANDRETIRRGFGWQVYNFAHFIHNHPKVSDSYKTYKREIYYTPEEILSVLEEEKLYTD